jgi:lipopolysaccharide/colanic/teichoic acid biosynthesis glycosyltransferase
MMGFLGVRRLDTAGTLSAHHKILKRVLDIAGALIGLIFLGPFILLLALAVKLDSAGSAFFLQERIGENGRRFKMIKLRSMRASAERERSLVMVANSSSSPTLKISDDPRVTRLGRWLRRWSLDELPQLWNVLRGDMSLVGPRPEESAVVAGYSDWHRQRLAIKPGLTGPMQINGRGLLSLDERVRLELNYIENYSIWLDLEILIKTIPAVLSGWGAF